MADNRIYIRCRTCGRTLYLGKIFAYDGYYFDEDCSIKNTGKTLAQRLNDFYDEHMLCDMKRVEVDEDGATGEGYSVKEYPLPDDADNIAVRNNFDIVYEDNEEITKNYLTDKENNNGK